LIYLTQTDTTVGFVSTNPKLLSDAKKRDSNQPFLICVDSYLKLKQLTRIPKMHKKRVRRARKTSFLCSNKKAIRVVKEPNHARFLKQFNFLYSTSANKNKKQYDYAFAYSKANIIIVDERGLYEVSASNIFKLGKKNIHKLR